MKPRFSFHQKLHGVVSSEALTHWNGFPEDQDLSAVVRASPTLKTIQAIIKALKQQKIIALIDPSSPSKLENSVALKLHRYLEKNKEEGFGIALLTSGTTGTPKLLLLKEEALYYSALGAIKFLKIDSSSHLFLSLPLYHVSGLGILFRAFLTDATLHLSQGPFVESLHRLQHQITHLSLVRTQASKLIEKQIFAQCTALQCILLGGSSFPDSILKALKSYPFLSYLSYGMSETASIVWAYSLKEGTGKLLPYRKLRSQGTTLSVGGKTLFSGYIEEDGSLSSGLHDGYFLTSDCGSFEETTEMLTLSGRSDDLFLFGGENISKQELEEALGKIQGVKIAIVIPLASSQYGHVPIALLATDLKLSFSEWKTRFSSVLPKVKMPKGIVILQYFREEAEDAKQRLSHLKQEVTASLTNFEDLPEESMVRVWNCSQRHESLQR